MKEGFYSARFKGEGIGDGFAVLVFMNGVVVGASSNEATYNGDYETDGDSGHTAVAISVTYPPGGGPKARRGDGAPLVAWGVDLASVLPPDFEGKPIIASSPFGTYEFVLKFMRGLPGAAGGDEES
jgi:hypothetical protein